MAKKQQQPMLNILTCSDWSPVSVLGDSLCISDAQNLFADLHENLQLLFDILFNLPPLCRLLSVWFLKCDSGTWKTRKWNAESRMLCDSFTTTHQAWPETTSRSLGKVPRKSSGEKLKLCVYGLLPSNRKVTHVPALSEALCLVLLSKSYSSVL